MAKTQSQRKLQVFVSSTYEDLKAERQTAVEAILTAGHIPAGMELFAAGDESQMDVIKRWIDESDVFLLILGGRYGSIEPSSGKSYIQLEYEYALKQGKALFAVVIDDKHLDERIKQIGKDALERENPQLLKQFKATVQTRLVKFWSDPRDIKLAVLETLPEFSRRDELVGWIPGNKSVDTGALAEEIARLGKENASLRDQLAKGRAGEPRFNGLVFDEMYQLLLKTEIPRFDELVQRGKDLLQEIAAAFGDPKPGLVHALWALRNDFSGKETPKNNLIEIDQEFERLGLIHMVKSESRTKNPKYLFTANGQHFLMRLRFERATSEAERLAADHSSIQTDPPSQLWS